MSIQHCFTCDRDIDTDFDSEHFEVCQEEQENDQDLKPVFSSSEIDRQVLRSGYDSYGFRE